MRVPAVELDGHEPHARLDQPPGEQRRLPLAVHAVRFAQLLRLGIDAEGVLGGGRGDQVVGLAIELAPVEQRAGGLVDLLLPGVEPVEHRGGA